MVEVRQEDREAAARYWGNDNPPLELQREFARHRIAALDAARGKAEPVAWQRRRLYSQAHEPAGVMPQWESCTCREATDMFEKRPGCEYRPLYSHPPADRVAQVVEWLRRENGLCDCHARCETECGCGAWDDWKTKPLLQIADAIERGQPFNG